MHAPPVAAPYAEALDQVQAQARVQARRLQELLAQGAPELVDAPLQWRPRARHDRADQGVAVGVQSRRGHRHHHVGVGDPIRPQNAVRIDGARRGPRDVVVVGLHDAWVLGSLTADQGRARGLAGPRDALHDGGDALGHHAAARDVVRHEQRARPDHHDVVDDHADQVLANRAVRVHRPRDRDLGAHPVRRGRQQGTPHAQQGGGVHHPGETAGRADHGVVVRARHSGLHELDGAVSGGGVHSGGGVVKGGVGHGWCLSRWGARRRRVWVMGSGGARARPGAAAGLAGGRAGR